MHIRYLTILCDPVTKEDLALEIRSRDGDDITEGFLVSSKNRYPIRNGIPRFVSSEGYSANFGFQWKKWSKVQFETENVGRPMVGHTTRMFERITEFTADDMSNKLVLDIGCGSGRFSDVALRRGANVVGIDYSSAIDVFRANVPHQSGRVLPVQCDALMLPFKDNAFDHAFSIGVLHHTPDPYSGCREAFRVIKEHGSFALAVYGKGGYYGRANVQMWRKLFQLLWPMFGPWPPLIYAYASVGLIWPLTRLSKLLSSPLRILFPIVYLRDKRWSILDTFDSVTPSYQSAHASDEVRSWFSRAGFLNMKPTDWGSTSYKGWK